MKVEGRICRSGILGDLTVCSWKPQTPAGRVSVEVSEAEERGLIEHWEPAEVRSSSLLG